MTDENGNGTRFSLGALALKALLGLGVVVLTAYIVEPYVPHEQWALIDDEEGLEAAWDPVSETIDFILTIEKRTECEDVSVLKSLRRVNDSDEVSVEPMALASHLPENIMKIPVGVERKISDHIKPAGKLQPGEYIITFMALCSVAPDPEAVEALPEGSIPASPQLVTPPVQVKLVVSGIAQSMSAKFAARRRS